MSKIDDYINYDDEARRRYKKAVAEKRLSFHGTIDNFIMTLDGKIYKLLNHLEAQALAKEILMKEEK